MRSFYLDTSALIKLYHQEAGTEQVEALFIATDHVLVISELAIVELYSALARKVRTGEITLEAQEMARQNFEEDRTQRLVVTPLGSAVIEKAKGLLQKHGTTKALRALDALHLAACLVARTEDEFIFVGADERLLEVCQLEGVEVLHPEGPAA